MSGPSKAQLLEGVVHDLAQEAMAADALVAMALRGSVEQLGARAGSEGFHRGDPLYVMFEYRVHSGQFSNEAQLHLLGFMARHLDRMRMRLQNALGALDREAPIKPRRRPLNLNAILQELVELFQPVASTRGISIRTYLGGDGSSHGDSDLLYRLFGNLLDNAIKYSYQPANDERHINIASQRHSADGTWRVVVSSFGVGILPEELRDGRLFEYGARGMLASDRDRKGTGIGLAEAKRIALAHGGRIELSSEPTEGTAHHTRVEVYLP